jgi:ubiquinone/menaquinone biosynthesis C-methylase UbiE
VSIGERLFAALYDPLTGRWEERHGAALKRPLLAHARGRTLEIGVGTGRSFPHYAGIDELVGVEPSEPMRKRARRRAEELGLQVTLHGAPAEALPFEDQSFETVVTLAVLCTVRDPVRALAEIRRVLRRGGRFVFLEHVRSDEPRLAHWQDRLDRPWGWVAGGCHPNRDTLAAIDAAGFDVVEVERRDLPDVPRLVKQNVLGYATRS